MLGNVKEIDIRIAKEDILNLNMKYIYTICDNIFNKKHEDNVRFIITTDAFNYDNRPLCIIPEWVKYMRLVAEKYPALIFYLKDDYKELMLTSVASNLGDRNSNGLMVNLVSKKIGAFIKAVDTQLDKLPYTHEDTVRIKEWDCFIKYIHSKCFY